MSDESKVGGDGAANVHVEAGERWEIKLKGSSVLGHFGPFALPFNPTRDRVTSDWAARAQWAAENPFYPGRNGSISCLHHTAAPPLPAAL